MDDFLIVRMSDRSRERFTRNRRATPLGAILGLALGVPAALVIAAFFGTRQTDFLGLSMALGLVFFAFLGRFLISNRKARPTAQKRHFDGMPFDAEDEESEDSPSSEETAR